MGMGGDGIQIDKGGFVRIHYEILELLAKAPLTGGEFRCLMFLFRKTYGFNKKEDKISLAQWADGTGMKRQNVWSLLQALVKRNIIFAKSSGPKRAMVWGFNKHYEQWDSKSVMPEHDSSVSLEHDSSEQSVMLEDDRLETSVMPEHDKSVIPPHERTIDSKDSSSATTPPVRRNISDFAKAYERIWGLTISSPYIGEQVKDWENRVTFEGWSYALQESADTKNSGNWKYLRKILERIEREGYRPQKQAIPQSATTDFAMEDISL